MVDCAASDMNSSFFGEFLEESVGRRLLFWISIKELLRALFEAALDMLLHEPSTVH
jgi:hypothetical protein